MSRPRLTGNRCECPTCGELFSRTRAFDRHRIGAYAKPGEWKDSRRCLTPEEMTARGWQRNAAGAWVMQAFDAAGKARTGVQLGRPATHVPASPARGLDRHYPAGSGGWR